MAVFEATTNQAQVALGHVVFSGGGHPSPIVLDDALDGIGGRHLLVIDPPLVVVLQRLVLPWCYLILIKQRV